jgi:hypothetical protein
MKRLIQIKDNLTNEYTTIYALKYDVTYNKLWGSTDRNLRGSLRGTIVGIVTAITVSTDWIDQVEAENISTLLNQDYMTIRLWDSASGTYQEELYTSSDLDLNMVRINGIRYDAVSFTLTSVDIRGVIS